MQSGIQQHPGFSDKDNLKKQTQQLGGDVTLSDGW